MIIAHHVAVTVFASGDEEATLLGLAKLFPFSMTDEKITIERQRAEGFRERIITVLRVRLAKQRQIRAFLEQLFSHLDLETLRRQLESRLDEHLDFFIRLDKPALISGDWQLTDGGDCYHLRISVAAFPHTREVAIGVLQNAFSLSRL